MTQTARFSDALNKGHWFFFALYLALFGSFCGLEIDTVVQDLPFFQVSTFLLITNVLFVLLVPPLSYAFFSSIRAFWKNRAARVGVLILNTVYFYIVAFLAIYKSVRKLDFDFNFLWYNTEDALPVLWKLYAPWLFVLLFSMVAFAFLQSLPFLRLSDLWRNRRGKEGWFSLRSLRQVCFASS